MYLNQAQSDYSDDNSDTGMDESSGSSFGLTVWNFGGRNTNNAISGKGAPIGRGTSSKRSTQQVLATARAVANDMNHPNQDEVGIFIWTVTFSSKNTINFIWW